MNLFKVIFWATYEYNGTDRLLTHEDKSESEFDADVRAAVEKVGGETLIDQIEDYLVSDKGYRKVPCKVHNTGRGVQM